MSALRYVMPFSKYIALLVVALASYLIGFGIFAAPILGTVRFSIVSTLVFGLATYLLLVVPMYLFAFLAVNSRFGDRTNPMPCLIAAVLISIMVAPASWALWLSPVRIHAIVFLVVVTVAGLLLFKIRETSAAFPGRSWWIAAGSLLLALILVPSTLFWLFLPYSLIFLVFAALWVIAGLIFSTGWWLIESRTEQAPHPEQGSEDGKGEGHREPRRTGQQGAAHRFRSAVIFASLSAVIGLITSMSMFAILKTRTRTVVHQMEWQFGGTPEDCGARNLLSNKNCRALNRMVCSDEVDRYLKAAGSKTVLVTYAITDDFGKVFSYTIQSIGPVRVDFKSDESIKTRNDGECMFQPPVPAS